MKPVYCHLSVALGTAWRPIHTRSLGDANPFAPPTPGCNTFASVANVPPESKPGHPSTFHSNPCSYTCPGSQRAYRDPARAIPIQRSSAAGAELIPVACRGALVAEEIDINTIAMLIVPL